MSLAEDRQLDASGATWQPASLATRLDEAPAAPSQRAHQAGSTVTASTPSMQPHLDAPIPLFESRCQCWLLPITHHSVEQETSGLPTAVHQLLHPLPQDVRLELVL